jgi:hypothetical protein
MSLACYFSTILWSPPSFFRITLFNDNTKHDQINSWKIKWSTVLHKNAAQLSVWLFYHCPTHHFLIFLEEILLILMNVWFWTATLLHIKGTTHSIFQLNYVSLHTHTTVILQLIIIVTWPCIYIELQKISFKC